MASYDEVKVMFGLSMDRDLVMHSYNAESLGKK